MSESNLRIDVTHQPSRYHKFRYQAEVATGTQGGYLYNGCAGEKGPVRLRISGIDMQTYKYLVVIGGTVSSDYYPHPYFMIGDNCDEGLYKCKTPTDTLGGRHELSISLEKISLICVKKSNLPQAILNRLNKNFDPYDKNLPDDYYNGQKQRLKTIRIAFQVFYADANGCAFPTSAVVATDEIGMKSEEVKLDALDVHPNEVHVAVVADLWVYFENQLSRTDCASYTAHVYAGNKIQFACTVKQVKKHLVIVTKPNVVNLFIGGNKSIGANLTITDTHNDVTSESQILLLNSLGGTDTWMLSNYQGPSQDPPAKRKRSEPSKPGDVDINDLLASFL